MPAPLAPIRQRQHLLAARLPSPRLLARAAAAALLAGCAGDPPTAAPRSGIEPLVATAGVLSQWPAVWDQNLATGAHVHMSETDAVGDDFVVPADESWTVSDLVVTGSIGTDIVDGVAVPNPITVSIRADDGGAPGAVLATVTGTPAASEPNPCATCGRRDYLFRTSAPLSLGPGTYWIVVSLPAGSFFTWAGAVAQNGSPFAFSDAGGPWTVSRSGIDIAFALYGDDGSPESKAARLQVSLTGMGLEAGTYTSLNAKLKNVAAAIEAGDTALACNALQDFINQVNALAGKKMTTAQAQELLAAATALRQQLGC